MIGWDAWRARGERFPVRRDNDVRVSAERVTKVISHNFLFCVSVSCLWRREEELSFLTASTFRLSVFVSVLVPGRGSDKDGLLNG